MALVPDPTESPPPPDLVAEVGPAGGPHYRYRGAEILCARGGHVCRLAMAGHPLDGITMGVVGTLTPLVDLWIEEKRLPHWMRAVPKAG
jgi:hypothetical protein